MYEQVAQVQVDQLELPVDLQEDLEQQTEPPQEVRHQDQIHQDNLKVLRLQQD